MPNLIHSSDMNKLLAGKIKGEGKTMFYQKIGTFCQLISAEKRRWALKGKREGNFEVDFFTLHWSGFAPYVPVTNV